MALDGLIPQIRKLSSAVLKKIGIPLKSFWNRKGFHGLNAQCGCDAWCRFLVYEVLFPGSTHDLKAYTNGLFFKDGIPLLDANLWQLCLDEAYKSIKDGRHLTPFPQLDIEKAESDGNVEGARIMRLFNKVFCSL